ncbi:hypothetical protein PGTUg99_010686 [Puccinia graminis f. sp. tritici]|nr:hypothetical protein PGTUg99_010686 [Puccinia graminis f. sp. tritici]
MCMYARCRLSEFCDEDRLSVGRGGDVHETEPERYKDTDDMSSDTAAGQTTQPIDLPKPTDSSYGHADILQTLPIDSSPSCLEWSNDGQAFAVTKANIYLLTPILGYLVSPEDRHTHTQAQPTENGSHSQDAPSTPSRSNPSGIQESIADSTTKSAGGQPKIPFFTTIIEINKQLGVNWSTHSNDISTITPPNDDRFWRAATWSPSGLSALGSCLLAGLSTTCDVFVYSPCQNYQAGLWAIKETLNLSEELLTIFYDFYPSIIGHQEDPTKSIDVSPETAWDISEEGEEKRSRFTAGVLRTQATCIAWSPAYSHSNCDTPVLNQHDDLYDVDFSLLAVGHRRGDLSLWRHTSKGHMELESFNPICSDGRTLNLLSWSDWKLSARRRVDDTSAQQYQLTAHLAVANSKGVVYLMQVCRPFERPTKPVSPISRMEIQIIGIYQDPLNQSSITYFKWLPPSGNTLSRLIISRLGEIVLVPLSSTSTEGQSDSQSGLFLGPTQVIQLPVLQPHDDRLCWADCNSWATCSGMSIIPTSLPGITQIIAMLSNGLIFVLRESLDPNPSSSSSAMANPLELDLAHSVQLSLDFRAKFRAIGYSAHPPPNSTPITKQNVMSVYGSHVLSGLQHVSGDHQQLHSIDPISLLSSCIMSWLYEIDAPNKFRYKPENHQILQFCLAYFNPVGSVQRRVQLLGMLENQITAILPAMLSKSASSILVSPSSKLLNIFNILHSIFSDPGSRESPSFDLLNSTLSNLVDLLPLGTETAYFALPDHQPILNYDGGTTSMALKSQLINQLFYNLNLDHLRLKVNLCNFLLGRADKAKFPSLRSRLVEAKVSLSRVIHRLVLQTIAQFFLRHVGQLSSDERPVFNRYQCATKAIDRFPEPTIEQLLEPDEVDHKLLDQDRLSSAPDDSLGNGNPLISFGGEENEVEQCPACLQSVCFDSLRFAICRVGHVWDRCSVTFQILSTIKVRICTGCGRKSMVKGGGEDQTTSRPPEASQEGAQMETGDHQHPSTSTQQEDADVGRLGKPSLVQVLLDSSICCWHCGGRWRLSS